MEAHLWPGSTKDNFASTETTTTLTPVRSDMECHVCYWTPNVAFIFAVGRQWFHEFLKSEFSEENIEFWIACEDYKNLRTTTTASWVSPAQKIFSEFIAHQAPREVSSFYSA